ncbi:MAG: ParB N-terminal domain-containing protein [Nitrososphaerales archaeon]|jgi:hypothetical protein
MVLERKGVKVDVRPVSSLMPHEETIPAHVERIASEIKREGIQRDPIIFDAESQAVLDGMHRLAAFARLGLEYVVCCPVDYSSRTLELNRWARVYTPHNSKDMDMALFDAGISKRSTMLEAFTALNERRGGLAAISSRGVLMPAAPMDLDGAFALMRSLDEIALKSGWKKEFVPEEDVDVAIQDERSVVVLVQRLGKDDVVKAARNKKLFPHKTSMHTVDPRPVAVDVPIEKLKSKTGAQLAEQLRLPEGEMLPPGSIYQGRRYKERLLLLNSS